ncbi:hypothetical protein [Sphingomonas xanthus]|uniref:Mercuric transport protein MerT n=1 Tax=Sphingomonas xanthus TaxID=2594473 RepID=A0A516IP46_9SPHN|nr:hypothetical protein [Sphingomonas xanthus]QDP18554.1 hypothetical protein FMM02_00400 [Sphingomonas xanthus]
MADDPVARSPTLKAPETGVAAVGAGAGFTALFSAAVCCVLPLVFAAVGLGAGGLAAFVPYHWPLTIASAVAISIGWLLYWRKRRACAAEAECASAPPPRATLVLLCIATAAAALSAVWPRFIEQPLMKLLAGA